MGHTTINQKAAAIAAETAVEAAAMADGSNHGRGAFNNEPKSGSDCGRNGGRGSGNGGSHGRGEDSGRGCGGNVTPAALAMMGAGNGGGRQQSIKKWQKWQSRQWQQQHILGVMSGHMRLLGDRTVPLEIMCV
jgi:hypothetical protein